MSVNGVNVVGGYSATKETKTTQSKEYENKAVDKNDKSSNSKAVVYKKSNATGTTRIDNVSIEQMKAEAEQKTAQLRSLVEKMMTKQGIAYHDATDFYALLREGKLEIDPEVAAKAKEDISEKGYWGIEQTSDRLVSFAKALAGNDPGKADELMEAIEKGYQQATKAWGAELPDICKRTLEATREKMKVWKEESVNL